jgi:hypothetical protein
MPFLAWEEEIYAVDLAEGARGRVLHWEREARACTVEAPSFDAWLGLVAACAEHGVLGWRDGIARDSVLYVELQGRVLAGYPRPVEAE